MRARDTAALLILSTIWGSAFLFNHEVVRDVDPLTVVAGRLGVAALVLAPLAARRGGVLPPRTAWPALIFLAAFNNVIPFALITAAQVHISSSVAATLVATMPLFVLLFASAGGTEHADIEKVAGLIIGFVGAALLIGPDLGDLTDSNTIGQLAVIAAAACYAISTVLARPTSSGDPVSLASAQMIFGVVIAVPLALIFDGAPDGGIGVKAGLSWLALGTLSSGIAYIIFFTLVQRMKATQLSVVSYLIPFVATVLGWVVLDETIGPNLFAGLLLIVAGVMAVNGAVRGVVERVRAAAAIGQSEAGG